MRQRGFSTRGLILNLPTVTATAAAVAATTATGATGTVLGLVDAQCAAAHFLAVQGSDHRLHGLVVHFDEPEATGTTRLPVVDQRDGVHGTVHSVALINDRETGRPRGFGFIEVDDEAMQPMIAALDGKEMGGRALRVNEAQDRPRRTGGGGGGYGGGRGGDRW